MTDDPTFPYRVAFGLTVFAVLGGIDLVRHPEDPRRLKEYGFLFAVTAATMVYGLAHDAMTFAISPEYFHAIKGLRAESFFPEVAELALTASWTVGLAIGLACLVANNPSKRPQLTYPRLARELVWPLVSAPVVALLACVVARAAPRWTGDVLGVGARAVRDPSGVATVWAVHLGTYVGAAGGLVASVLRIRRERRRGAHGKHGACRFAPSPRRS